MDYEAEFRYADTVILLDTGPAPNPEFLYADTYLEWELTLGVILDHLSLRGAKIR